MDNMQRWTLCRAGIKTFLLFNEFRKPLLLGRTIHAEEVDNSQCRIVIGQHDLKWICESGLPSVDRAQRLVPCDTQAQTFRKLATLDFTVKFRDTNGPRRPVFPLQ